MRFKLIVFDLDDTLVATSRAEIAARSAAIEMLSGSHQKFDVGRAMKTWFKLSHYARAQQVEMILLAICLEQRFTVPAVQIRKAAKRCDAYFLQEIQPTEGAKEVLEQLRKKGARLGICSNGDVAYQLAKLQACGLTHFFQDSFLWIAGIHTPGAKPSPMGLLELVKRAGVSVREAVYVGDRLLDIVAGNIAGYTTILYEHSGESIEVHEPRHTGLLGIEQPSYNVKKLQGILDLVSR